jgi:peptidoglycan/xylan/chitin deacetylase (PgdA/CDA1 family)
VALTFDDGFRNNAEVVVPILKRYSVPGLFFIASRHVEAGRYLWFSYLKALQTHFPRRSFVFRGETVDMSPIERGKSVGRLRALLLGLRPHPQAMYHVIDEELPRLEDFIDEETLIDRYQGMTAEQVGTLCSDSLFTAGVHTVDHPFLTKCSRDEAELQIRENKTWLEGFSDRECRTIAYPADDYDLSTISICAAAGLTDGYAVLPLIRARDEFEKPRLGVYFGSLSKLAIKAAFGKAIRKMRLRVG